MLIQSAFFLAYFLISAPARRAWSRRLGYMRSAAIGADHDDGRLACCSFPPPTRDFFPTFLLALFVLAAGITVVQVVAKSADLACWASLAPAHSRIDLRSGFSQLARHHGIFRTSVSHF